MNEGIQEPAGRPTRTSTALAVVLALGLAAAFVSAAGVTATALVGAVGAGCLALALWTSRWERGQSVGTLLASLLALPVGLGLVAVTAGTYLVLASQAFPVDDGETVRSVAFVVVLTVVLATATFGIVFGALATTRPLLERTTVGRTARTVLGAAAVPLVPGALAGLDAGLSFLRENASDPESVDVVGPILETIDAILLDPSLAEPHPATFALLVGGAAVVAGRAVRALPLTELATDRADGEGIDWQATIERVERGLTMAGVGLLASVPVFAMLGLLSPGVLPTPIAGIVASGTIRHLAVGIATIGLAVVGVVRLLRWSVRASGDSVGAAIAPFVGGAIVFGLVVMTAEPLLSETLAWVLAKLPAPFDEVGRTVAESVIDVYGPVTIVLLATAALFLTVAGVLGLLWAFSLGGVLDGRRGGGRIAGACLFLAAAAGAVVGISRPLVLAGIVGGLVVADLDAYGTTLGNEIGRRARTARPEVLHALGTVVVAATGAVIAVGVASVARNPPSVDPTVALVGLLGGLAGAVVLFAALR